MRFEDMSSALAAWKFPKLLESNGVALTHHFLTCGRSKIARNTVFRSGLNGCSSTWVKALVSGLTSSER